MVIRIISEKAFYRVSPTHHQESLHDESAVDPIITIKIYCPRVAIITKEKEEDGEFRIMGIRCVVPGLRFYFHSMLSGFRCETFQRSFQ